MSWWLVATWPAALVLFVFVVNRAGRWYRSSDRQTELDRMIKKQRRLEAREQRRFARRCNRVFGRPR